MSSQSRLMPISYYNPKQFIRLNAYADLIVYEQDPTKLLLRAIRFGGEPEMVRALADALYAGAELEVEIGPDKFFFASEPRKFQRQLSHDGLFAEAVLLALDDGQEIETEEQSEEQQQMPQTPRNCFIFGPVDDQQYLFEEIDRKTTVPLIQAFRDYLLEELQNRKILALALLDIAAGNGRKFALIHFAAYDSCRVDLFLPGQYTVDVKMNAAEFFLGGGTNFERPMQEAIRLMDRDRFENSDIVFVTDGECTLSEEHLAELKRQQAVHNFKITCILLDSQNTIDGFSLDVFCQQVYRSSPLLAENIAESMILDRIYYSAQIFSIGYYYQK